MVGARLENGAANQPCLCLTVQDTGVGTTDLALEHGKTTGVGLRNIERRLACQYGSSASLSIQTALGVGTTVEIRLPTDVMTAHEDQKSWKAR